MPRPGAAKLRRHSQGRVIIALKFFAVPADKADMDISAIALQGLAQAESQLNNAATAIANYPATVQDNANIDTVDLSTEIVALTQAQTQFAANIDVLETADQIQQNTFDATA